MQQEADEICPALEIALKGQVKVPYSDESELAEIGLDSLAVVRIVVEATPDSEQEIEVDRLAEVNTVGELRAWLVGPAAGGDAA